jgi:hypothetical protein
MTTDAPTVPRSDRSLLLIGAGLLGVVVVAALIVVLLGSREAAPLPADSPEGVVQRYLAAFEDGDYPAAYGYFSQTIREGMDEATYERSVREFGYAYDVSRRVLFDRTTLNGDRATVHLTVEEYYSGGPFGAGDTYRSSRMITLVREDGAWRIDDSLIGLDPGPFPELPPFGE